jgi:hypothetical protein
MNGFAALNSTTGVPLPIRLTAFSAAKAGSRNLISWSAATAADDVTFEVTRSSNGSDFVPLGTVKSSGQEFSYAYYDESPLPALNYYRIKIAESNGELSYSNIAVIRNTTGKGVVTVAPVPAISSLTIANTDVSLHGLPAEIYSMEGRLMASFALETVNTLDIQGWPAGIYMLRLPGGETIRLVKQ